MITLNKWQLSSECNFTAEMNIAEPECGVKEYIFTLSWDISEAKAKNASLTFFTSGKMISGRGRWDTSTNTRGLFASWKNCSPSSRLTVGAPVSMIFGTDDENVATYALSEIEKTTRINPGPMDEDVLECIITLPMAQFNEIDNYTFIIREDTRRLKFYTVLDDVRKWWEKTCSIDVMPTPMCAREPLYSTWYAYHTEIDDRKVEKECLAASKMGMKTVILDDGWQFDGERDGYIKCGDWEFSSVKFPDFKSHVKNIHDMGMKYMVWFSVPYIGKKSEIYPHFEGKYLYTNNQLGVLDPRYPDVRDYLASTFERFVRDYDLDGLKLDFVDSIVAPNENDAMKEGMDIPCVQSAASKLMTDIKDRLTNIRDDIMIEFRQSYIGPGMRQFGNMFRVGDCQADGFCNHVNMTDIRLLMGSSAVHSDMLTWHNDEPVTESALQLIDCLFGTLQYSLRDDSLDDNHRKMAEFWIKFMAEHIKLLQMSEFIPHDILNSYPLITARDGSEELHAVYIRDKIIQVTENAKHIYIANGTADNKVHPRFGTSINGRVISRDCMGNIVSDTVMSLSGICALDVPPAGLIEITAE